MTPVTAGGGNPADYMVEIAVLEDGERPELGDWHAATWGVDNGHPVAMLLIGPEGAVNPGPGTYRTWVRIQAPPERPVIKSPRFTIS